MPEILWAPFLLSLAAYVAACVAFLTQARRRSTATSSSRRASRLLEAGAGLHLTYLILFAVMDRRCPVYSMHSALGFISLVGVVSYAALSRARRMEALGGFVAASAAVFLVVARFIGTTTELPNDRWMMAFHITSNLLGGGLLLVAGCAAAFYIWNERRLRARRGLGQGTKLPPLESLDSVIHRLLWIGVPLLTIGLLTGKVVMEHAQEVSVGDKLRAGLSSASWLVLLIVLGLRQFASWRGRRPAYVTLLGSLGIFVVISLYILRALMGGRL